MRSRLTQPGGNEYAWDDKRPGVESDQDLFFFSNWNSSVSNKVFSQLFVCLSLVGLVEIGLL